MLQKRRSAAVAVFLGALPCLLLVQPASAQADASAPAAAQAGPEGIELSAYEALLKQYTEQIQQAKEKPAEIARIGQSLPYSLRVHSEGVYLDVPLEKIRRDCAIAQRGGTEGNAAEAEAEKQLQTMLKAAEELEKRAKQKKDDQTKQQLEKVFARAEFRGLNGPGIFEQWGARVSRWVERQIERLFRHLHVPLALGRVLIWPVLLVAFAALTYLVLQALGDRSAAHLPELSATKAPEKARYWLKEALAAAERGEYREAVHCGYWAAITRLEARELLAEDKTRTPREAVRLLETHPTERGILREQTTRLERIWYGGHEASASDWSSARMELEQMGCL